MTNNDTFKLEEPALGSRKFFRVFPFIVVLALMAGSFTGGMYWERSGITPESIGHRIRGLSMNAKPAVVPGDTPPHGPVNPQTLDARLTEQIRAMHSNVSRLDEEAKEGRIHYNLLLQRGYKESDEACMALVSRQRELTDEIDLLQDSAEEAEALRQRLRIAARNLAGPDSVVGVEESLRREARQFINRTSLSDASPTVIPDTAWMDKKEMSNMTNVNGD